MSVTKIVITGGPCAGKSTAMVRIREELSKLGYTVLFVPETATELITGGVTPWGCGANVNYQKCQMELQLEKEKIFEKAAEHIPAEKILIVCDRGTLDNKAYMNDAEFAEVLAHVGANEVSLRDGYDAVFHLLTAAKGAAEFYTTANNAARKETPEEAIALDDKIISAWTGHPHLRIIGNGVDFEEKLAGLIHEIVFFLGEPAPYEIERKFLIEYPDLSWLESNPFCKKVEITQTYLDGTGEDEIRVRKRGYNGNYIYFKTTKMLVGGAKRVEVERHIKRREYEAFLAENKGELRRVEKTRYCLCYENQYFEIDLYPFWTDRAVVELELSDENAPILFPEQIKVIREVTGEAEFKNSSLAKKI